MFDCFWHRPTSYISCHTTLRCLQFFVYFLHLFWWLSSKTLWLLLILTEIYSAFQIFVTLKLRFDWTLKIVASIVSARSHICSCLPPVLLNINMKPKNFGETVKVLDFSKSLWKVLRGRDIKVGTCAPSSENPLKIRPTLELRQLWQRSPRKNSKLDLSFYISWPETYWYIFCFLHWIQILKPDNTNTPLD